MGDTKGLDMLSGIGGKMENEANSVPEETPWETVDSRQIHSIRREPNGTVGIRFKDRKTGGVQAEYHYDNVSEELYEKMRAADSIGRFFDQHIKKNPKDYPYRKQEADKA
jgi:hypothetical protein